VATGGALAGKPAKTAGHAVGVYEGGEKVADFSTAKCTRSKRKFTLLTGHDHGWIMYAQAKPFSGYHHYNFPRGHATGTYVELSHAGVDYASDFKPPAAVPAAGGLEFTQKDGSLVGVGFMPMFSADGSQEITVTGVLRCSYPKTK
jgi:hypothetical protein